MTLSTILIANTLVNVAASTLSGLFFAGIFNKYCDNLGNAESLGAGVATGVVTLLVLVFGEFLPKTVARKHSLGFIKVFGIVIYILYILF